MLMVDKQLKKFSVDSKVPQKQYLCAKNLVKENRLHLEIMGKDFTPLVKHPMKMRQKKLTFRFSTIR